MQNIGFKNIGFKNIVCYHIVVSLRVACLYTSLGIESLMDKNMLTDLKKNLSTNLFGFTHYDFVGSIFSSRISLTLVLIASGFLLINSVNIQEVFAPKSTAFVLVDVNPGREAATIPLLQSSQNVKEIYEVYGVHEFIVKVEANSMDELKKTITDGIRKISYVASTFTMVVK